MEKLNAQSCIHILDCTKILVNRNNENYENYLKTVRKADTYLPAKENRILYQDAVTRAVASGVDCVTTQKSRLTDC